MTELGLARYDAMCSAIAACHGVDEVKELRDKAKALEVYAHQARNIDAERKAAEVRIRAERRAGELLNEMKERGARQGKGGDRKSKSNDATLISKSNSTVSGVIQQLPTLADLGITRDQSSKWQQLAEVPEAEFEKAVRSDGPRPSTEGIILANRIRENPMPKVSNQSLWFWGQLQDFERNGCFSKDPNELIAGMTESMRDDVTRLVPLLRSWLEGVRVDDAPGPQDCTVRDSNRLNSRAGGREVNLGAA